MARGTARNGHYASQHNRGRCHRRSTQKSRNKTLKDNSFHSSPGLAEPIAALLDAAASLALARARFDTTKPPIECHKTKDILHVMEILGHRSINNTQITPTSSTSKKTTTQ